VEVLCLCALQPIAFIALAADGIDICEPMFDGDQVIPIIRWITVILLLSKILF
jgi:hypothetical protein